jgi:pyrimidine operon attenuation protein/uracil phosphoribosyltransferase
MVHDLEIDIELYQDVLNFKPTSKTELERAKIETEISNRWNIHENDLVYDIDRTPRPKLDPLFESKYMNKLLLQKTLKKYLIKDKELKYQDLIEFENGVYRG